MLCECLPPEAYFTFVCLIIAYVRLFVNGQNLVWQPTGSRTGGNKKRKEG